MPSLIDIRRRVRAVKSTQQITKAMKMIAASRLKRAQDRIVAARPFAQRMQAVLNGLVAKATVLPARFGVVFPDDRALVGKLLESQQALLTAIQEKKFPIMGQSERSSGPQSVQLTGLPYSFSTSQ